MAQEKRLPPDSRRAYWGLKMEAEKARAAHEAAARELPTARAVAAREAELEKYISASALALEIPPDWEFDRENAVFRGTQ